ncbi:coiled-coil domain-containing protein 60-like [Saccoglossus kowalevskii]
MAPKNQEPRKYIQPIPLPIPSHQGLLIQARSDSVYNCTHPTRNQVFRDNYARRQRQMREQGYNAISYKPYRCVGEPFYLDEKKIILHALGQLENEEDLEDTTSSSDEEKDKVKENKVQLSTSHDDSAPKKFVLRRKSTQNKKTLSKELTEGRRMITSVKLGHGLFNIISAQDNARRNAKQIERAKIKERARREWQPAHVPSSSDDETDDELAEEVDLSVFMAQKDDHDVAERKEVAFSRMSTTVAEGAISGEECTDDETIRFETQSPTKSIVTDISVASTKKKKKKKKAEPPRPYTPCHSNINVQTDIDLEKEASLNSIFRQLCALNWLLESMIVEPPAAMGPILQCWNIKYKELKQNSFGKTTVRKIGRYKQYETNWKLFRERPATYLEKFNKKPSRFFGNTLTTTSARNTPRRGSAVGVGSLIQRTPSTLSSNHSSSPTPVMLDIPDKDETMSKVEEDPEYERSPFLESRYDSASVAGMEEEMGVKDVIRRQRAGSSASVKSSRDAQAIILLRNQTRTNQLSQQQLESRSVHSSKSDRHIRTWVATTSRLQQRAQSCKGIKTTFPSQKYWNLPSECRHRFTDVAEEKALVLHDSLELFEKKRLWRSEEKFKAITNEKHISKQLDKLKHVTDDHESKTEAKKQRKKQEEEVKWFQELIKNIPHGLIEDRRVAAIVDKLESIGNIESRKITPQRFLNVLTGLRSWELCSPDICAAVEFVRAKIVNMAVEDFEGWCEHYMPRVSRAQSAPPR